VTEWEEITGMSFRAVLAGCGAMSKGWLEALSSPGLADKVTVAGLVDVERAAAERRAAEQHLTDVSIGTDLGAVLRETGADIVLDVVPPAARRSVVETGLAHGCHVLSEKPMATSLEDAHAMLRAAEAAGRLHAIVQNRRFNNGVRRIRGTIESGVLGTLNAIHSDFFVGAHFGGFRDEMQHVLLIDMAIHTFDAARFMSGKEPLAVYCHESNPASSWYAGGSVANAIFELSDDVLFTYRGSWSAEGANTSWDAAWRIVGSNGTLLWDGADSFSARVVDGDEGFFRRLREIEVPPAASPDETRGHRSVIADFISAIEGARRPETDSRDNIKSLAMVFAAIESATRRERVNITF
jgi:predicted dehydrogenase